LKALKVAGEKREFSGASSSVWVIVCFSGGLCLWFPAAIVALFTDIFPCPSQFNKAINKMHKRCRGKWENVGKMRGKPDWQDGMGCV